jgi:hypothetical protein
VRERHHVRKDQEAEFNLHYPIETTQTRVVSQRTMMLLLASVAAVALVVGGIGIMNIMLVSDTSDTRPRSLRRGGVSHAIWHAGQSAPREHPTRGARCVQRGHFCGAE